MSQQWTAADTPSQRGRVAIITGANSGIGFEAATVLAKRGAYVVLAVRDNVAGKGAAARIAETVRGAELGVQELDLAALDSVAAAARALTDDYPRIDILINNAGVMFTPQAKTSDGFELQFGTNHLGHFALTGGLLASLLAAPSARVVTVSSLAHRFRSALDLEDINLDRGYSTGHAYGRSKLANLLFTFELDRRLRAAGRPAAALAAHPGGARTNLARHVPDKLMWAMRLQEKLMFQSAEMGALPALRAATDPAAVGGQYYGPDGLFGQRGYPVVVRSSRQARDPMTAQQLWAVSESLTGVRYEL